jgi:hypothetical protein
MAFVTGEVIPDPHASRMFRVVFRVGTETIVEWTAYSEILAKAQIIEGLKSLRSRYHENGPSR